MKLQQNVATVEGSPKMTVIKVDGEKITCKWFDQGITYQGEFEAKNLRPWIQDPPRKWEAW